MRFALAYSALTLLVTLGGLVSAQTLPARIATGMNPLGSLADRASSAVRMHADTGRDSLLVSTASGTALEERGREQLLRLVATHDVHRWLFTHTVRIQSRAIPHSHPVLTLNTRYIANDTAQLATFLHEQFHWYVSARPDSAIGALKSELRRLYPDAPDRGPAGARDLESTYLHLIVCTLEYEATAAIFGRDVARRTLEGWTHYTWVYRTVLADNERLVALLAKHGFGIDAGAQ